MKIILDSLTKEVNLRISLLAIICSALVYSCASGPLPEFNKEKNCSPRALKHIEKLATEELTGQNNTDTFRAVQSCYHSFTTNGYDDSHNICLVMSLTRNGVINFLDINDHERPMDHDLQKCIIDKLAKINFTELKSKTIFQPLRIER